MRLTSSVYCFLQVSVLLVMPCTMQEQMCFWHHLACGDWGSACCQLTSDCPVECCCAVLPAT